jgi:hypothetical protein
VRPGGEKRGNSYDRRRRRRWLMKEFDPDIGPDRVRCHLFGLSENCLEFLDIHTLTVDRIEPGGSYARDSIRPACKPCQNTQGALITQARRIQWKQLMEEARARGIDWERRAVRKNLGVGQADHERTAAARLHLQALVALGWSQSKLAHQLGLSPTNLGPIIGTSTAGAPDLRVLTRGTVDKIEALYDQLSMTLPPETNQRERIAASRSRRYAKERQWKPPLALEDVSDVVLEDDYLDEAAIERRMAGDKTVRLTKAEKAEVRHRWMATGRSLSELERATGINSHRDYSQEAS